MKPIHHASATIVLPPGFVRPGWLCERCEKQVTLPEELGSPARCPRCRKPTAVWIPPAEPVTEVREPRTEFRPERQSVTKEEGKFMFEDLLKKLEDGTAGEEGEESQKTQRRDAEGTEQPPSPEDY